METSALGREQFCRPEVSIRRLLEQLYGQPRSAEVELQVRRLITTFSTEAVVSMTQKAPAPLSERDALLITYADQVSASGQSPLHTLGDFCAAHLADVVSGVHLLPFYPWSSDDGFSVKDFFAVDPAYGTWEDIAALGRRFDLRACTKSAGGTVTVPPPVVDWRACVLTPATPRI